MASTRAGVRTTDNSESAMGYIHNVSSVKTSDTKKTRYFNALLQTDRNEYHDMVVFQTELHRQFTQAAENRTSVKVTNITRCLSFRNPKGFDYKTSRFTKVEVTEVSFPPKTPDACQRKRIEDVKAIPHSHYIGEVKGKVLAVGASPKTIQRRGLESNMLSIVIADESAQIKLQLWDSQISAVKMHTSYAFTNLSVREYDGDKFLTTTKNSTIVEIDTVPVPETTVPLSIEKEDALLTVESEVVAVKLASNFTCRSCYKRQSASFNARQPFQRCDGCQLLRKTSHFLATTSGVLHVGVDGVEIGLTLNNSVLQSFLETHRLTHLLEDTESLEMHFLTLAKIKVCFNAERFITKLSHTEPRSTGAPVPRSAVSATASHSSDEATENLDYYFKD